MRGKLSKGIQEKSLKVLNREITEREMRLYAYVDFCLKMEGSSSFGRSMLRKKIFFLHYKKKNT